MRGVTVLLSDKYNPTNGLQPFDPNRYEGLSSLLNKFYDGEVTAQVISRHIIEALFDKEFSHDKKWGVDTANCSPLDNESTSEFPAAFQCSKQASYDHKDIYAVAEAKAKIIVQSRELIHIELYSYYVAG
jgi:hypothetical protein